MHTHMHTNFRKYMRAYIRTYIHAFSHTYIHAFSHTYIHTCVLTYIHTYIHTSPINEYIPRTVTVHTDSRMTLQSLKNTKITFTL